MNFQSSRRAVLNATALLTLISFASVKSGASDFGQKSGLTFQATSGGIGDLGRNIGEADGVGKVLLITLFPFSLPIATSMGFSFGAVGSKIIVAQEDAANFVASEGRERTAQLEEAFVAVRSRINFDVSDLELAEGIITAEIQ